MQQRSSILPIASIIAVLGVLVMPGNIAAEPNQVTVTPINDLISLEKTTTTMTVPKDNKLPWGTVRGEASEYAERYPVIIQFYKGEEPVHFAQVNVKGDGSYEYKFRVGNLDADTGEFIDVFEGQYTVKIYRVIPNYDGTI